MTRIHRPSTTLVLLALLIGGLSQVAQCQSGTSQDDSRKTFAISGSVGVAGARMVGLPGGIMADDNGNYAAEVPAGWSGVVMPVKEGYEFDPPECRYTQITKDLAGQDYKAVVRMVTISDSMVMHVGDGDEPVEGVTITARPGDYSAVTDAWGRYTIQVPYGWTGELFMTKPGFDIQPYRVRYTNVTEDIDLTAPKPLAPRRPADLPKPISLESADDVLVIPTKGVAAEQFAQTAEDMRVMLDIFRETLSEARTVSGVLYDYGDFFGDSARTVEALYIQGYAAIFMMRVDFPFSLSSQPPAQVEAQKQEPVDPVWQRARDRLYSPQGGTAYGARRTLGEADTRSFDQFKEDLLKALKHAANIRHIEPNEWIILTVTGQGESVPLGAMGGGGGWVQGGGYGGGSFSSGGSYGFSSGGGAVGGSIGGMVGPSSRRAARYRAQRPGAGATVLTLQARRADIDAFAKGQISFEQFQQKVKIFTY